MAGELPIIQTESLTRYYGDFLAVDHISFEVQSGEIFGFLGPNGAGKTTTVRMLTTLLEPTEGTARLNGYDVSRQPDEAKRQFAVVPEESNIYTSLSARDNLLFAGQLYLVPRRQRGERARELLARFGLEGKENEKTEEYSKGMRRRVAIAMALMSRPPILFLDEPTTGLDVQSRRLILELVREVNAAGTTIFLTTHQIEEANQVCDRVAIISHGCIAAIDTPERLRQAFKSVQSVEVALESNDEQTRLELGALPGVMKAIKLGDKVRLYTDDPPTLLPQIVSYAAGRDLRIFSLNTLGPSLEDVFLKITGEEVGVVASGGEDMKPKRRQQRGG